MNKLHKKLNWNEEAQTCSSMTIRLNIICYDSANVLLINLLAVCHTVINMQLFSTKFTFVLFEYTRLLPVCTKWAPWKDGLLRVRVEELEFPAQTWTSLNTTVCTSDLLTCHDCMTTVTCLNKHKPHSHAPKTSTVQLQIRNEVFSKHMGMICQVFAKKKKSS